MFALLFGAMSAGQASAFVPDYATAQIAAARIFRLFERIPDIDNYDESGEKPVSLSSDVAYDITRNFKLTQSTHPSHISNIQQKPLLCFRGFDDPPKWGGAKSHPYPKNAKDNP